MALSPELVQFVTHAYGIVEPPKFYLTQPPPAVLEPSNTRVGTAGELTLVIHSGPVRFTALPRAVNGSFELRATLAPPYAHPRVTVRGDKGSVEHPEVTIEGTAFRATFTCAGTTSWIEVNADDDLRPLAVVPVACGTAPNVIRVEPERNVQATNVERRLTALINRERIAAHLSPLRTDRRTTLAAVSYAQTMMRADDIAHDLAGVPLTRVADAGRRPLFVDETRLRAADLAEASLMLLNEPTYRAQVLAKNTTHVGVGVAKSASNELFVAIDYIQILPPIDVAELEARVARQIIDRRNTRRLLRQSGRRSPKAYVPMPPLVDDELKENARYYARMLAAGWSAPTIDINMNRALLSSRRRGRRDGTHRGHGSDDCRREQAVCRRGHRRCDRRRRRAKRARRLALRPHLHGHPLRPPLTQQHRVGIRMPTRPGELVPADSRESGLRNDRETGVRFGYRVGLTRERNREGRFRDRAPS